ncbi:hypothetical protein [Rhodococcus jostii]|uniref:hypothetical protein n=1 Tax=Rhodococcus jostii TaxID=132919 RepID=UPI00059FD272|nr:hypothetical protein [Rhodococcus jostii]
MGTTTVRLDAEMEKALAVLTAGGETKSSAIRGAILDAARRRQEAKLRAEAAALREDPEDRAEAQRVLGAMESLRAW